MALVSRAAAALRPEPPPGPPVNRFARRVVAAACPQPSADASSSRHVAAAASSQAAASGSAAAAVATPTEWLPGPTPLQTAAAVTAGAAACAAVRRPPSAGRGAPRTPRLLPPMQDLEASGGSCGSTPFTAASSAAASATAASSTSRCSTAASSTEADDKPASEAHGTWPKERGPPRRLGKAPGTAAAEMHAPVAEKAPTTEQAVHPILATRRQATQGGRSFFQWSFRSKAATAKQKYAVANFA